MNPIEIHPGTDEEREWAARVMAATDPWITLRRGLDACLKTTQNPDYLFFVARSEGRPCGFMLVHPRGMAGSPYIASIAASAECRGAGVGTALLEFAAVYFQTRARHLFLCVSSFNARARALYERNGFAAVGELEDYIIAGASEILMHKRLGTP
jgi:ribosomal protein S18 acetylase RimI-like enzyme